MKHKLKRVFALLLSLLMLVNSVPVNAFATEVDETFEETHEHTDEAIVEEPEHVHSAVYVEAKDASCTEDGNIAYFYCECGKYFYDQEATAEIPAESVVIAAAHSWGEGVVTTEATEEAEGVMTYTCICGETKEDPIPKLAHTHRLTAHEANEASCTEKGNSAYWSCDDCGKFFSDEGNTEIEEDSWVINASHSMKYVEEVEATCTKGGSDAYWTCANCSNYFSDENGANKIEKDSWIKGAKGHGTYQITTPDASCTTTGGTLKTCPDCGHSFYETVIPGFSGHVWDFSKGSASSNKENTLTIYPSTSSKSIVLENGTLVANQIIMKMSKPVVLDAAENWTVEIVAKAENSAAIKTVLSTGSAYGSSSFIYINNAADLMLGIKGKFTADDGTTVDSDYTYYKVSNADFEAKVPADFDVNEYHAYQLRCEDGVFSYWLDGEKIGNLALSEQETGRGGSAKEYTTGSGTPFASSFKKMSMNYMGNGNSSGNPIFGLTGTVQHIAVYSGHSYSGVCDDSCDNEGCKFTRADAVEHTWDEGTVSVEPTANTAGEMAYECTVCGATKKEVIDATGCNHEMTHVEAAAATCGKAGNVEHWHCALCQKSYSDEAATKELSTVIIPALEDYVWDFSQGTAASTNGDRTFSMVTTHGGGSALTNNGTMTFDNGVMSLSKTALQLDKSIALSAENDWAFEITMTSQGTAMNLLAQSKKISSGIHIHLTAKGSLGLMKHGTLEGRDTADYWIYQVSDADFAANMPADFDPTQFHTYRLECNDGIFSYWLDGRKIGDLSITRNINSPIVTHEGRMMDYSNFSVQYMSSGTNANVLFYGVAGDIKSMGVYPSHNFTNTCDTSCDNEGCTHTRKICHTWDNGEITTPPSGTTDGVRTFTCTVCGETKTEAVPVFTEITMKYDDRLAVSDLEQTGEPVITTKTVASTKVGTDTKDDAVVAYVDGKLIAVGVGTAEVIWGAGDEAAAYLITVEPATISMIMVTGHSLGSGSKGDNTQSIISEEGQVYCTNERAYAFKLCTGSSSEETVEGIDVTGMGLGYSSELRPTKINALNESGSGVNGIDSAIGYRWAQLTGEKVWILNSAKGSTSLQTWQKGGYNYRHAVELFTTAEEILYNEVQAGHYIVNKLGIVNYTTANGDQTWAPEKYTEAFNSMWNGFQSEMALYDFDGDGDKDTVDCIGLLPLWNPCSINQWDNLTPEPLAFYTESGTMYYGKLINYSMSAYEDNGVIIASTAGRNWLTDADVTAYFQANPVENMYGKLQNGTTHTSPTTVQNGVYGDGVHYAQLGYNVQGIETADSMYEYWYGGNNVASVKLLRADGVTQVPAAIEIPVEGTYVVVPEADPSSGKLSYTITGDAVSYDSCILTGNTLGTATLTVKDQDGKVLKTVDITVREKKDEDFTDVIWYEWDFSKGSATNTAGSSTDNTLTLEKTGVSGATSVEDLLADGTLNATKNTTMELGKSIVLDSSRNWAVELVAKGEVGTSIRAFLSTSVTLSGSYVFINESGDLSIVRKGSFTADDGTAVSNGYTYYKVSNEDFAANMPADFDITQYHSYQLRCEKGVFSYWLDDEKIGDLALSEQTTVRGDAANEYTKGTGTPFQFNTMTMTHVGCGSTNNASSQGLLATVKELNLYSDSGQLTLQVGLDAVLPITPMTVFPGDVITLPQPDTGDYCAKFIGWSEKQDGTGTQYKAGDIYTVTGFAPVSLYGIWEAFETSDGEHVFENGVCVNCGAQKAHKMTATGAKNATCTDDGNSAYWFCSECGKYFADEKGNTEIEKDSWIAAAKGHSWNSGEITTEPSATAEGVKTYSCSGCTETKTEAVPATDYAWDFEKGEAISTFGTNTISLVTVLNNGKPATNGTMSVADGVMTVNTAALELAHSVKLSAETKWAFEITMKAHTNANGTVITPKTVLAENKQYSNDNSIYINNQGSMSLLKKGTIEGTNDYWYYRVPSETFNANMPAGFDMTQYHTYRLECNGDTFSFWLDGEKIGDLGEYAALNKKDASGNPFVYSGNYLSFESFTAKYIGNGSSSNVKQFGFTGDVDQMRIITGETAITHAHTMTATEAKDATCTEAGNSAYWYCPGCQKYFSDAKGENEIAEDAWIVAAVGHKLNKSAAVKVSCETDGNSEYWTCSVCSKYFSDAKGENEIQKDSWIIEATGHAWDDGVITKDPTETETGIRTFTCGNCGETRIEIVPIIGHTHKLRATEEKDATCTEAGNSAYWSCSGCDLYFADEEGSATIEKDSWIIAAKGHIMTAAEAKDANCAEAGNSAYWYCSVCEKYFSDAEGEKEIQKDSWIIAAGHKMTKTEAVDATCTADGNSAYWTCSACDKFFSDEQGEIEIEKDSWIIRGGHQLTHVEAAAATCGKAGNVEHWHCALCQKSYSDEAATKELSTVIIPALEDYVWDFSQGTTASTNGDRTFSMVTTHGGGSALTNNGTMTFDNGVMSLSKTALQLDKSIALSAENDWAFEITMTSQGTAMNLLAQSKKISSGIHIHLTAKGSLGLMKHGTLEGRDNADYWIYQVSDADFAANMPADFDPTQFHTYRLECNDGIFSYWLDGRKIGDLSITRNINSPIVTHEGRMMDYSNFSVQYISSGTNANVLFYGVAGDIKSMGVYPAHSFDNSCDTTCNNEGCTFTRVTQHAWGKGEILRYPTETESGERKFTCSGCGEVKFEEIPTSEHFHKMTKVEATEVTCVSAGNVEHWNCSGCGKNFADEEGLKELETVVAAEAMVDTIWNFAAGSAVSGNGNELSLVKSADAEIADMNALLKDGALAALSNTTMKLSKTVTLKSSEDWMIELVAKGEAGSAIRSFMSTSVALSGVYVYINEKGDLSIVKKGAFTADDGTAVSSGYTYYKVSDEDYNMSILTTDKFDFTEYHSYQLRCEDGVFSFWLDNEKIGDLALSEQTGGRSTSAKKYTSGNGTPFDFSKLVMAYVGCGSSSNSSSQGLKATVKELGIYPAHSYDNSCDASCNNEGCTYIRQVNHTWNYGEITKAPTETTEGERTYTCVVCSATKTEVIPELGRIVMEYDDRLRVTDLGQKGEPDSIVSYVTSKKVGTDTPDDAVLVYVDGKLIAVGVGTAEVTWGTGSQAVTYNITVEPAVISMLMVTGHSLGSGSQGTASKTIICEDGEIYCTNERAYAWKITTGSTSTETVEGIDVTGMGLGYGSEIRPKNIDALNESGAGVNGVDSAVAYRWAQLTGEKVWILNSAKGSTSLQTWQKGGFNYRHAVELFTTAEEIMYNEVQAGHYKLNKMGIVNFTTANGDQTWPADQYTDAFNSMWEGFQEQMRVYDFDGDNVRDTVDCISLLPLWNVCAMNKWDNMIQEPLAFYTGTGAMYYGKLINYSMSAFEDNGVILGSSVGRQWTTDTDVTAYFKANPIENMYGKLQDGTTDKNPTTLRNGVYGDGVHYGQLGYNVLGIDIAQNMYDYWYGNNELVSLRLLQADGVTEVPNQITVRVGEEYVVAPDAEPACAKLTYSMTGNGAAYTNCMVVGVEVGEAVLTIQDQNGNALKTISITILPAEEVEQEEVVWYAWDFAQASATNTSGSSLDNTLTLVMSADSSVSAIGDMLKNGTLDATQPATMTLSKPVTLKSSRNWAVELVAKNEDANSIRAFMSTDATIAGTYFYIDANGDLSIVKKGSFKSDDGATIASGYTYYKVSDADFNASVLGSGNFDITEYHSYQLRCTNGTFSYWLDGEKIGDLSLSEQTTVRGDSAREYTKNNGTPFDFSELIMTHIGCGSSANAASQGLTATVKALNIYTSSGRLNLEVGLDALARLEPLSAFPGETIVLPRPNNGEYCAKFLGWAENRDGTGERYQAGDSYTVVGFEPTTLYGIWQAYETSDGVHTYVNGVCTSCGVADGNFNPWDIWDFEGDVALSDDGVTTISRITTNHQGSAVTNNGTMSVSGGVMHVNTAALEMSDSIQLTAGKDWTVDFTMKALVDSNGEVIVPKTLLAEDKLFSVGSSFYLTATGDMLIAQKGNVGGTNTYWYFKVSDADFAANMPAKFDITKYHTYRIMSTNGVLSYWLDGVKIGDFALTSDNMGRGGTVYYGQKLDYSNMNVRYIGNGNTGNCKAFGFTGDVEQIGIYTAGGNLVFKPQHEKATGIDERRIYPGEKLILPKPDTGEHCVKFLGWTKNADGSGTLYPAGSIYKVEGIENLTLYGNWEDRADGAEHTYGKPVVTDPTCAAQGYTTYTCTFCGHEKITNVIGTSTHSFTAEVAAKEYACTDATYDIAATYYRSCIVCGMSSEGTGGESTFTSGRPGDGYYSVVTKQDWDTAPGITESEIILNNSTGERRQAVHVMQVDISDPYASILPSYMGMNPTPGNFKLGTMSQQANWVEENMGLNVVGAMNTCLSWYDSAYYDEYPERKNEPLGILVIDGEVYAENTSATTCLVVNYDEKDGVERPADIPKVELRYTKDGTTGWEEQVVSCNFDFIVKDGKNLSKVSHVNQSSKSVLGIKADGTIVIMQNDGEQAPYSNGMSIYEIAETMITLGCVTAVRCDGGGTSTYLSQRPGEELKVTCSPADGAERPTTSGILVISSAPSTGEFMRATITSDDTYYTPGSKVTFHAVGTDLVGTKVDVPEDVVWQIKEKDMGTIDDGVFVSNGAEGKVTVQLLYKDKLVGEHTIEIVIPETFQFRQSVITVPYGKTVDVVLVATINDGLNTVTLNSDDIVLTTDNEALGTFDGISFTAAAEKDAPADKTSNITATLKSAGLTAKATLNLGKASVVIDDFEDGVSDWNMYRITSRESIDFELVAANPSNGYVHSGNGALGMIMHNETQMQQAGYYAQLAIARNEGIEIESATSLGAWVYVPDDFYNLWIRMSFYTKDESGAYTKRNVINAVEGGEVYTTIEESGWHYFSCDISEYESVYLERNFIEILSQHCSANALYQTVGSPHGMSAIYVDDVTIDYSEAADDREEPIFNGINLVAGGTETALLKRGMPTTSNSVVTFKASVAENTTKTNATGLDSKSATAYVDGVPVGVEFADGTMIVQNIALADGAHRVKFEISDNAGNTAVAIRVISVASGVAASTIHVVPADPSLDRLYGGSVYWMDLNATNIETIQKVSFDIDLNAVNHWELEHMELAEGFSAAYTVDAKTNTASIAITRTGENTQRGKQTLASLPIRVIYFDTDIALEGYTAQTFWQEYNFWPQDVAVDVDRGVIEYVDGYVSDVCSTFSSNEYSIDTEMYTSGQHMDPAYKAQRGTAHVHSAETMADTAATCTEDGYLGRTYCEVCDSIVEWGTKQTAAGHKYKPVNGVMICSVCREKLNGVLNGKTYIDGILADGWIDDTYYYVNGVMVTGQYLMDGTLYNFDENGVYDPDFLYTGFYETSDGKLMYFAANKHVTGYQYIVGEPYYFDANGVAYEGEYVLCAETCLFEKGQFVSCSTADLIDAGMAGNNVQYVIYADGTMVLGGSGATYSFPNHGNRPFIKHTSKIKKLVVGEDITRIGTYFMGYTAVKAVEFTGNSKLAEIASAAFYENTALTEVTLPNSVNYLSDMAFGNCSGLAKVTFGTNAFRLLYDSAFRNCNKLTLYVLEDSEAQAYAIRNDIPYVIYEEAAKNGIVAENDGLYYYRDGELFYAGLIEIDGAYYYVRSNGQLVTNHMYWVTKTNGLMTEGEYAFGVDGRMVTGGENSGVFTDGIIKTGNDMFYYSNGELYYAGLINFEGDYYYVRSNGQLAVNRTYWITKTNGLLPEGDYSFDTNGRMIREGDGIVDVDGTLYYLHNGQPSYVGLISMGDDYYYVRSNGQVVTDRTYWITKTNGILPEGSYAFAADGKMRIERKITIENVDGVLYCYREGTPFYAGLFELDGNYYYARSNSQLVVGRSYWISKTNGIVPEGLYFFGADGRLVG